MFLSHSIVFLILLLLALVYLKLAVRFGIVDKPNHRSSHNLLTVRGGGILFPFAIILWWMANDFVHTWMVIGMIWISAISLLDDIYTISSRLRFLVQFISLSMAFFDLGVFEKTDWIALPILYFVSLGIINAINFMDGINGITGLYGLLFFGTMLAINKFMPLFDESMVYYIILAVLVFLIFNFRKRALMFAGDIGSISLAFLIIYFMVQWYMAAHAWTIILLLSVYGVDVCFTMFERWRRGERLSEPHRSHLYQLLANQYKLLHVGISLAYTVLQAGINFYFFVIPQSFPDSSSSLIVLALMSILYFLFKTSLKKRLLLS